MENYKKIIKRRIRLMAGFNCLAIIFIILTGYYGKRTASIDSNINNMIYGFQPGVFTGLQLQS